MASVESEKIVTRQQDTPTAEQPSKLRELYETHAAFVCRSLRRLGVAEPDLDDLLQEVFLVVYQRLPDYEERDKARAWLYSISVRVAQAQRRSRSRRRETMMAQLPDGEAAASQLQSVEDRQALELGQRLLSLLTPEQREVFVLYEVEDMPMQQIAEAVGCPLQTGYSRLYKARLRILAEVERARADGESP
jgi:RNA polymerase sigma-70 factor (ECF subfamily)